MRQFDIVLVFFNSRLHNHFLSIIKYLSRKYNICIWVTDYHKAKRTPQTNDLFLQLCENFGATVIKSKEKVFTKLLFLTHITALDKDIIEDEILENIICNKKFVFQAFGVCGGPSGNALLETGFNRYIVFDKKLFHLRSKPEDQEQIQKLEIIEMGNVVCNYPVFDDFNCDYLICMPTQISFETEDAPYIFLRNLIKLLNKISKEDSIMIKAHTAKDNESPFKTGRLFGWFVRKNGFFAFTGKVLIVLNFITGNILIRNRWLRDIIIGSLYKKVLKKCKPLSEKSKYWNFGAELFFSGIQKGLITGRSTTLWFGLTQKIPIFNCDPNSHYEKTEYLNKHFEHYGVPFSNSKLVFDKKLWEKIPQTEFNIMEFIASEIDDCK